MSWSKTLSTLFCDAHLNELFQQKKKKQTEEAEDIHSFFEKTLGYFSYIYSRI